MAVLKSRYLSLAGVIITAVFAAITAILVLHLVFVFLDANGENPLVSLISALSGWFAWLFKDMFIPANEKLATFINYGIAIVVYAVIGFVLRRLFR